MGGQEQISLAIVTRDRAVKLEQYLLESLRPLLDDGYPVVVVDQSADDSTERLVRDVPEIHYLRSEPGISRARNVAVRWTESPFIAFTDDDVTLPPGWLDKILRIFDRSPSAGAICGRGVSPRGALLPGAGADEYRWPKNPFGLGSGFNMAFRCAVFEQIGLFDEDLGGGAPYRAAEDTDMFYRVMKAGWAVVCSDEITVVHHEWRSVTDERELHRGYGLGAGAQVARHVAAGDRTMIRIAAVETARHVATTARAALFFRPRLVRLQAAFLGGFFRGLVAGDRAGRGQRDEQTVPP